MTPSDGLLPHDAAGAVRAARLLLGCGVLVAATGALLDPPAPPALVLGGLVTVLLVAAAVAVGGAGPLPRARWVLLPLLAVAGVSAVGVAAAAEALGAVAVPVPASLPVRGAPGVEALVAGASPVGAPAGGALDLLLLLPVVFAASQLRAGAARAVAAASVLGRCAVAVVDLAAGAPVLGALAGPVLLAAVAAAVTAALVGSAERREAAEQLRLARAALDPLTGLVMPRLLDDVGGAVLLAAGSSAGVALLLVAPDPPLPDASLPGDGLPTEQAVVLHVAQQLADGVPDGALLFRAGGRELALLLPGTSPRAAERSGRVLAGRVRSAPLALPGGGHAAVTVSVGVAHAPTGDTGYPQLRAAAQDALDEARRAGGDRAVLAVEEPPAPGPAHDPLEERWRAEAAELARGAGARVLWDPSGRADDRGL